MAEGLDNHTQKYAYPSTARLSAIVLPSTVQYTVDNDQANANALAFSAYAKVAYVVGAFSSSKSCSVTILKALFYPELYNLI